MMETKLEIKGPDPKSVNPNTGRWSLWRGSVHVAEYLTYADAVLFASAPRLLSVQKQLVEALEDFDRMSLVIESATRNQEGNGSGNHQMVVNAIKTARAAILAAKASS